MEDLKRLYNENTSFKRYVDKCIISIGISCKIIDEALELAMVKEVAKYYAEEVGKGE